MTDDELLARLAETPVEDWTPDEVELLRARMPENAALREALREHLVVETTLTAALARPSVSAEAILARVDAERRARLVGRAIRAAAVLLLAIGFGGGWYLYNRSAPVDEPRVARVEPSPLWPPGKPSPRPTPSADVPRPVPTATAVATAAPPDPAPPPMPPQVVDPAEPWVPMLAKAPRDRDDLAFDDRRLTRDPPQLTRWWDVVSGQQRPYDDGGRTGVDMDGLFRLRAPWPADALLTIATREWGEDSLQMHFWHGDRGVTLDFHQRAYDHWTAYVVTKQADKPLPATYQYAAGDDDRGRRTGDGPLDFVWHDGRLYMSRGDVLLLAAPLPGPPDGVYLDCHAKIKAMGLARSTGPADEWLAQQAPTWHDYTPAAPLLTSVPEGALVERVGDAGLALSVADTTKETWVALPITRPGIHEVTFDVDAADPNTGVYLGDATGKPKYAVGPYLDQRYEVPMLAFADVGNGNVRTRHDARSRAAPYVQFPLKLRLVAGPGSVKCYASADGRSWGRIVDPKRSVDGAVATVGVYCTPGKSSRGIRVSNIGFRTLVGYDDAIAGPLPPPPKNYDYVGWFVEHFRRAEPDDVRYHRLAKALASGPQWEAARLIGYELASLPAGDLPRNVPKTLDDDLDYIGRLGQVVDAWESNIAAVWADRIARAPELLVGRHDAEANDAAIHAPFSSVRRALVELTPPTGGNVVMLPADPIRREIARMMLDGDWERLDRACRVWHHFGGRDEHPGRAYVPRLPIMKLVDWAAAQAERRLDAPDVGTVFAARTPLRSEWRHPLVERFGKEGYNVLAELETALQERAYGDACRIITSVTAVQAIGLLPNAHDPELLTSLPGAVAQAMKLHPGLRDAMQREYGELALLRLRQATADGDVDAVRALTTQFFGTVAAAQAQMWLGDRALALGDATRAESHYRTAAREGSPDELPAVEARLRLAGAWQGLEVGAPPPVAVRLGDANVSPAEFERVVAALRRRAATPSAASRVAAPSYPPAEFEAWHVATGYKPQPWSRLDGETGKDPDKSPRKDVDLVAEQISVAFVDKRMIVSNRYHVATYELADGKLAWRTGLGNEQGKTYLWAGTPMPPVVVDGRIYVRRMVVAGPELACLDAADGRLLWRSARGTVVASDPLVVADRVLCVTLSVPQSEMVELELTTYDAAGGRPLARRPVAQLRDYWNRELPCFLTAAENMLVVSAGGCVIGCDVDGEPRWTRRLTWAPPSVDPYFGAAAPTPPTVVDGRVEIVQPGVPFRYVVDARTGGVVEQSVEVRDERVAPTAPLRTAPVLAVADGRTLELTHELLARKQHAAFVVWRQDGLRLGDARLATDAKAPQFVGPVAAHDGRLWAFPVDDPRKQMRKIVELVPDGPPLPGDAVAEPATPLDAWQTSTRSSSSVDAARFFPQWNLYLSSYDDRKWLESRRFIDENCFVTSASSERPASWSRRVWLPAEHRLALHVGAAQAGTAPWRLVVRVDGATVFEREYDAADKTWHDEQIDLTPLTGRHVSITVAHEYVTTKSTKTSQIAWRRLEIVEE